MTYQWNIGFESFPAGQDFGNVCCLAMRDLKAAFKERFEVEHIFDTGATPKCYHREGLCSIVQTATSSPPPSNLVPGALQYTTDKGIWRDTGAAMESFAPFSHLNLINVDDSENDHPQYVPLNPTPGYVDITGDVDLDDLYEVRGMPSDLGGGETDYYALSRGMHLKAHGSGGARHDDAVVTLAVTFSDGIQMGLVTFHVTKNNMASNKDAWDINEMTLEDWASIPTMDSMVYTSGLYAHGTDRGNDYVGHMAFGAGVNTTARWVRFDAP